MAELYDYDDEFDQDTSDAIDEGFDNDDEWFDQGWGDDEEENEDSTVDTGFGDQSVSEAYPNDEDSGDQDIFGKGWNSDEYDDSVGAIYNGTATPSAPAGTQGLIPNQPIPKQQPSAIEQQAPAAADMFKAKPGEYSDFTSMLSAALGGKGGASSDLSAPITYDDLMPQPKEAPSASTQQQGWEGSDFAKMFGEYSQEGLWNNAPVGSGDRARFSVPGVGGGVTYDGVPSSSGAGSAVTRPGEIEAYIREAAIKRGIDPDTAVAVAKSEGGLDDPVRQSNATYQGHREQSFGPFQLHIEGGVGAAALQQGIDPRDPAHWKRGVDFALDNVATGGWGPWNGAKRLGITGKMGAENARPIGIQADLVERGPMKPPVTGASDPRANDLVDRGSQGGRQNLAVGPTMVQQAFGQYRGGQYTFGGGRDGRGFGIPGQTNYDCSSFVSAVWAQNGLALPAHTDASYEYLLGEGRYQGQAQGYRVPEEEAQPGDVVYYMGAGTGGAIAHHMGIYAGPGKVYDMSVAGGGGMAVRDINHAGQHVIVRDARVNGGAPGAALPAPTILPSGQAERSGGAGSLTAATGPGGRSLTLWDIAYGTYEAPKYTPPPAQAPIQATLPSTTPAARTGGEPTARANIPPQVGRPIETPEMAEKRRQIEAYNARIEQRRKENTQINTYNEAATAPMREYRARQAQYEADSAAFQRDVEAQRNWDAMARDYPTVDDAGMALGPRPEVGATPVRPNPPTSEEMAAAANAAGPQPVRAQGHINPDREERVVAGGARGAEEDIRQYEAERDRLQREYDQAQRLQAEEAERQQIGAAAQAPQEAARRRQEAEDTARVQDVQNARLREANEDPTQVAISQGAIPDELKQSNEPAPTISAPPRTYPGLFPSEAVESRAAEATGTERTESDPVWLWLNAAKDAYHNGTQMDLYRVIAAMAPGPQREHAVQGYEEGVKQAIREKALDTQKASSAAQLDLDVSRRRAEGIPVPAGGSINTEVLGREGIGGFTNIVLNAFNDGMSSLAGGTAANLELLGKGINNKALTDWAHGRMVDMTIKQQDSSATAAAKAAQAEGGLGGFAKQAGLSAIESLPGMLAVIATGGIIGGAVGEGALIAGRSAETAQRAGTIAGRVAGNAVLFNMEAGETSQQALQAGAGAEALPIVITKGVINAAIEHIPLFEALPNVQFRRGFQNKVAEEIMENLQAATTKPQMLANLGLRVGRNGVVEGGQEAIQEVVGNAAQMAFDKNAGGLLDNVPMAFVSAFMSGAGPGAVSRTPALEPFQSGLTDRTVWGVGGPEVSAEEASRRAGNPTVFNDAQLRTLGAVEAPAGQTPDAVALNLDTGQTFSHDGNVYVVGEGAQPVQLGRVEGAPTPQTAPQTVLQTQAVPAAPAAPTPITPQTQQAVPQAQPPQGQPFTALDARAPATTPSTTFAGLPAETQTRGNQRGNPNSTDEQLARVSQEVNVPEAQYTLPQDVDETGTPTRSTNMAEGVMGAASTIAAARRIAAANGEATPSGRQLLEMTRTHMRNLGADADELAQNHNVQVALAAAKLLGQGRYTAQQVADAVQHVYSAPNLEVIDRTPKQGGQKQNKLFGLLADGMRQAVKVTPQAQPQTLPYAQVAPQDIRERQNLETLENLQNIGGVPIAVHPNEDSALVQQLGNASYNHPIHNAIKQAYQQLGTEMGTLTAGQRSENNHGQSRYVGFMLNRRLGGLNYADPKTSYNKVYANPLETYGEAVRSAEKRGIARTSPEFRQVMAVKQLTNLAHEKTHDAERDEDTVRQLEEDIVNQLLQDNSPAYQTLLQAFEGLTPEQIEELGTNYNSYAQAAHPGVIGEPNAANTATEAGNIDRNAVPQSRPGERPGATGDLRQGGGEGAPQRVPTTVRGTTPGVSEPAAAGPASPAAREQRYAESGRFTRGIRPERGTDRPDEPVQPLSAREVPDTTRLRLPVPERFQEAKSERAREVWEALEDLDQAPVGMRDEDGLPMAGPEIMGQILKFNNTPGLQEMVRGIKLNWDKSFWYQEFGKLLDEVYEIANLPGEVGARVRQEVSAAFGITSWSGAPNQNLESTLFLTAAARRLEQTGKEITPENLQAMVTEYRLTREATGPVKKQSGKRGLLLAPAQVKAMAAVYQKGQYAVGTNAKSPAFANNLLSAWENRYDPNSTIDRWMYRFFGTSPTTEAKGPNSLADKSANQASQAFLFWLGQKLGVQPMELQAAAWYAVKAIGDAGGKKSSTPQLPRNWGKKNLLKPFQNGDITFTEMLDGYTNKKGEQVPGAIALKLFQAEQLGTSTAAERDIPDFAWLSGLLKSVLGNDVPGGLAGTFQVIHSPGRRKVAVVSPAQIAGEREKVSIKAPIVLAPATTRRLGAQVIRKTGTRTEVNLPWIGQDHTATIDNGVLQVAVPVATEESIKYFAAEVGNRLNLDSVIVRMPPERTEPNFGGLLVPNNPAVLRGAKEAGLPHHTTRDGRMVAFPAIDDEVADLTLKVMQIAPTVTPQVYRGRYETIDRTDENGDNNYERIIEELGPVFSPRRQSDIRRFRTDVGYRTTRSGDFPGTTAARAATELPPELGEPGRLANRDVGPEENLKVIDLNDSRVVRELARPVQDRLRRRGGRLENAYLDAYDAHKAANDYRVTGRTIYEALQTALGSKDAADKFLKGIGYRVGSPIATRETESPEVEQRREEIKQQAEAIQPTKPGYIKVYHQTPNQPNVHDSVRESGLRLGPKGYVYGYADYDKPFNGDRYSTVVYQVDPNDEAHQIPNADSDTGWVISSKSIPSEDILDILPPVVESTRKGPLGPDKPPSAGFVPPRVVGERNPNQPPPPTYSLIANRDVEEPKGLEDLPYPWTTPNQEIEGADSALADFVPDLMRQVQWEPGTRNLDIGGGAWDTPSNYLRDNHGVESQIMDPFNQTPEHNREVIHDVMQNPVDTVTLANVLNVIEEPEIQRQVLDQAYAAVKPGGKVYISAYDHDHSGVGKMDPRGWWYWNKPIEWYLPIVQQVFPDATVRRVNQDAQGNLIEQHEFIEATKPVAASRLAARAIDVKTVDEDLSDRATKFLAENYPTVSPEDYYGVDNKNGWLGRNGVIYNIGSVEHIPSAARALGHNNNPAVRMEDTAGFVRISNAGARNRMAVSISTPLTVPQISSLSRMARTVEAAGGVFDWEVTPTNTFGTGWRELNLKLPREQTGRLALRETPEDEDEEYPWEAQLRERRQRNKQELEKVVPEHPDAGKTIYHGTNTAYDQLDPEQMNDDGLYGRAHYVTDDPRLADRYALKDYDEVDAARRRLAQAENILDDLESGRIPAQFGDIPRAIDRVSVLKQLIDSYRSSAEYGAPNVRRRTMAPGVRLFDTTAKSIPAGEVEFLRSKIHEEYPGDMAGEFDVQLEDVKNPTGQQVWDALKTSLAMSEGDAGNADVSRFLENIGYDGLKYQGGLRMPIQDEQGNDILHNAYAIFGDGIRDKFTDKQTGQIALRDIPDLGSMFAERAAAAPQGAPAPGPQGMANFNPRKFSQAARAEIQQEANRIVNNGIPLTNAVSEAARNLGYGNTQNYMQSHGANLTDLERAAVGAALSNRRQSMFNEANRLRQAFSTGSPLTADEVVRFVAQGMQYMGLHQNLTGDPKIIRKYGTPEFSRSFIQQRKGETQAEYNQRILEAANLKGIKLGTQDQKSARMMKEIIDTFSAMGAAQTPSTEVARVWDAIFHPKGNIFDTLAAIRYSALLGPRSVINAIYGNVFELPYKAMEDGLRAFTTEARAGYNPFTTLGSEMYGFLHSWNHVGQALWATIAKNANMSNITDTNINRATNLGGPRPVAAVGNALGHGLSVWNRFFVAADVFTRTIAFHTELGRLAGLEAQDMLKQGKITAADLNNTIKALYDSPTPEMIKAANGVAAFQVFQNEMGAFGQGVQTLQRRSGPIGTFFIPFLKTIYNIMQRNVDRTPLGALGLAMDMITDKDYRLGQGTRIGARPVEERFMRVLVGNLVLGGLVALMQNGLLQITGRGPDDDEAKRGWLAQDNQAMSFRVRTPQGWTPWTSYSSLNQPFILAFLGESSDAMKAGTFWKGSMVQEIAKGMVEATLDNSFMSTISQMIKAATAADNEMYKVQSFVGQSAAGYLPMGATLDFAARAFEGDKLLRYPVASAEGVKSGDPFDLTYIGQSLAARTPNFMGLRQQVPVATDIFGDPRTTSQVGLGVLFPWRTTTPDDDPTTQELMRLHGQAKDSAGQEAVNAGLTLDEKDIQNVIPYGAPRTYKDSKAGIAHIFEPGELNLWRERYGKNMYAAAKAAMNNPVWNQLPDVADGSKMSKVKLLQQNYQAARKAAWESMGIDPTVKPLSGAPKYKYADRLAQAEGISVDVAERKIEQAITEVNAWQRELNDPKVPKGQKTPKPDQDTITIANKYGQVINPAYEKEKAENEKVKKAATSKDTSWIPFKAVP